MGRPTQFVRFAGCNLRCPGWPCDTQHAIDPALYRKEWKSVKWQDLMAEHVMSWPRSVTLTGGEPLLQPASCLEYFAGTLLRENYGVDLFTNGTFELPAWTLHYRTRVIMDWKLPSSGEDPYNETRILNLRRFGRNDAVKFVVGSREDFDLALDLHTQHIKTSFDRFHAPHLYLGAAWGKLEEKELVDWMLSDYRVREVEWKLNVQVHNYIWPRDERGR